MAGQVGEYINRMDLSEWTDLEKVTKWFGDNKFQAGKKYSIYNNSSSSYKFIPMDSKPNEEYCGTYASQGTTIYYTPDSGSKIYIKGSNFNLVISEV